MPAFLNSRLAPIVIAFLHFEVQLILVAVTFGQSMARFDTGEAQSFSGYVLSSSAWLLSLPLLPLAELLLPGNWFSGLSGYILFGLNSLCWGFGLWWVLRRLGVLRNSA